METKSGEDDGTEYWERNWLWLGVDKVDNIAVFQSFGVGAIPHSMYASIYDAEMVHDYCSEIRLLQPRGSGSAVYWSSYAASAEATSDEILDRAVEIASRGVFVYYAGLGLEQHGYDQLAKPTIPIFLQELPVGIRRVVQRLRFSDLEFSESTHLCQDSIVKIAEF